MAGGSLQVGSQDESEEDHKERKSRPTCSLQVAVGQTASGAFGGIAGGQGQA